MTATLLIEIVAALLGLAALAALVVGAALRRFRRRAAAGVGPWHAWAGAALCAAGMVHGIAATAYASGAVGATYALGWLALASFAASGAVALRAMCAVWPGARRLHVPFFALGIALVVAHVVAGRI